MIAQQIVDSLRKYYSPTPVVVGATPVGEIRALFPRSTVIVLDPVYDILTQDSIAKFLEFDQTSQKKYILHEYDCDNFAFETFVNFRRWCPLGAFGIVIGRSASGGMHAWNFFLRYDGAGQSHIMFVEPQTCEIFEPTTEQVFTVII